MGMADALSARLPVAAAVALSALLVLGAPRVVGQARALARRLPARWRPISRDSRLWRDAALAALAASWVWVTWVAPHYGYNVDESWQGQHGRDVVEWYARALAGAGQPFHSDTPVMDHYGGLFEGMAELLVRSLPLEATLTRHLATAWLAVAGCAAAYGLGATLHSRAAGLLALLLLLATPRYTGHAFANPKDLPFAVCIAFSLLALCRLLPRLPQPPASAVLACGLACGAAMGVRIGGVLALALLGLALTAWLVAQAARGRPAPVDVARVCGVGLGVAATAWLVMLLAWPWAQEAPLTRPFQAIAYFRDIVAAQQVDFPVFYDGRFYRLSQVPRSYTLVWLLISLPEFVWTACLALPALGAAWRRRSGWRDPRALGIGLLVATLALALASTADPGVIQYDGMRHFLFVLPPLMVLLAVGLVAGLARLGPRWRVGGIALVTSLWLVTVADMLRLHPYEYTYFNRGLAGGLALAQGSYETDYLGLSYREAVRWVVEHVAPPPARPLRVAICKGWDASLADALAAAGAAPDRYRPVPWNAPADVAVAITRAECHRRFGGDVLAALGPAGTPLVYVIALRR